MSERAWMLIREHMAGHQAEVQHWAEAAFDGASKNCESPIEILMLAALTFVRPQCMHGRYAGPLDLEQEGRLFVQHEVGPYRVDFAYVIQPRNGNVIRLAVECDGHEFHSTKEQISADNKRDADLRGLGYETIRFLGREINDDPIGCARKVADWIDSVYAHNILDRGSK